ncbi:MAG: hypothetical protein FWF04_00720 [Clostridiales bacterium]|nr:hypothetical protein [Clostridiales bacterium]
MDKFIPYNKLSKRRQRELDRQKRRDWGSLNPITRKPQNPKAYKRQKSRQESGGAHVAGIFFNIKTIVQN